MSIAELVLIAISLSMDAFAVSVTNGICTKDNYFRGALLCGLTFGLFQGAMPTLGYAFGQSFSGIIERYDHFIVLILLGFIGINMIVENDKKQINNKYSLSIGLLLIQGFATSVDALAVGISFAALNICINVPVIIISVITLFVSSVGFLAGRKTGNLFKGKTELFGGIILIMIGLKIFIEHVFFS